MNLSRHLRNLAYTKQLNFLIGSGASFPAIPLMSTFRKHGDNANLRLIEKVKEVSEFLINNQLEAYMTENDPQLSLNALTVLKSYENFIYTLFIVLSKSNSRQTPRNANIFTTNYDLFIEKAIDKILRNHSLVFNDGASGYFDRVLDSSSYNRVVAYKGLNDNYINEIPSINLIKSHGSINWEKDKDTIVIRNHVVDEPVVVYPTGYESRDTFENNHFHEMLRTFQIELDKPQSVLFVLGFSCGDKHISKMLRRALQNYEIQVFVFTHANGKEDYLQNLGLETETPNLKILTVDDFGDEFTPDSDDSISGDRNNPFTLDYLTALLNSSMERRHFDNESN